MWSLCDVDRDVSTVVAKTRGRGRRPGVFFRSLFCKIKINSDNAEIGVYEIYANCQNTEDSLSSTL